MGENQRLLLSNPKRIERPDFRDLNPFVNTSGPKNFTAGNPYQKPEISNRYELGYNIDVDNLGTFMINAFYRISDNDIQDYIIYYSSLKVGDTKCFN